MLVLALDTTTRPGSIALVREGQVLASASGDAGKTHAERLPVDIVRMLSDAGVELSSIDAFGVAAGPGSFTGLRIGIATIQGLAFALNRPVVGVSCLDALVCIALEAASTSRDRAPLLAAWMDAQRSEVFAALYELRDSAPGLKPGSPTDESGRPGGPTHESAEPGRRCIDGPVSERPDSVLKRWEAMTAGRAVRVAGDGVGRYRSLLAEHLGDLLQVVEPLPPLAPVIGRMALRALAAGEGVPPHAIRPVYVRRPDAELARDRRPGQAETGSRDAG
jgi:tRNA threonylcarbamoyladenosine biosynthesis protein TsaB